MDTIKHIKQKNRTWLAATIVVIALLSLMAAIPFAPPTFSQEPPTIDLSNIGTKDQPTTDRSVLESVLTQIEAINPIYGPGWVHLQTTGYQIPPERPHPLHPVDGFRTQDLWFYVNKAGVMEKQLITIRDSQDQIKQQAACGDGICGNISKAVLAEFDHEPISNPFTPSLFSLNSSSSLQQEISDPNTEVAGWVEESELGPILFVSSYHSNKNNPTITRISPGFEGSKVTLGVCVSNGVLAYYRLSEFINGDEILNFEDRAVVFEIVNSNSEIDETIAGITTALKERDGEPK